MSSVAAEIAETSAARTMLKRGVDMVWLLVVRLCLTCLQPVPGLFLTARCGRHREGGQRAAARRTPPGRSRFARLQLIRAVSSVGRAIPLQGIGRWFEPSTAHVLHGVRDVMLHACSPGNSARR